MKTYRGDDVGTRMEHLADLQELWSLSLAHLTATNIWHTAQEEETAERLHTALSLLERHMVNISFDASVYAKVINQLPKAEDIK